VSNTADVCSIWVQEFEDRASVASGADVDLQDENGRSALHLVKDV